MAASVQGYTVARLKLLSIPEAFRVQLAEALTLGASAIARDAAARVRRLTGDLARCIIYRLNRDQTVAWVGVERRQFNKGSLHGLSRRIVQQLGGNNAHQWPYLYGVWIEFGRRGMAAFPFMRPAAETERGKFPVRAAEAGARAEQTLAGSTGLL